MSKTTMIYPRTKARLTVVSTDDGEFDIYDSSGYVASVGDTEPELLPTAKSVAVMVQRDGVLWRVDLLDYPSDITATAYHTDKTTAIRDVFNRWRAELHRVHWQREAARLLRELADLRVGVPAL